MKQPPRLQRIRITGRYHCRIEADLFLKHAVGENRCTNDGWSTSFDHPAASWTQGLSIIGDEQLTNRG